MSILIEDPGILSTVQDLGRAGYRQYGVMLNGALDQQAAAIANIMLDNAPEQGGIEATLMGPTLSFLDSTWICLMGADMQATLSSGIPVPLGQVCPVKAGDRLKLGRAVTGCRGYIAIKGGIQVEPVLGSVSTFLKGKAGGYCGRALKAGDRLPTSKTEGELMPRLDGMPANSFFEPVSDEVESVRYIPAKNGRDFDSSAYQAFEQQKYRVSNDSDRMGYRLEGKPLNGYGDGEFITEGVTVGTIQLPAAGQPIVLMNDSQTTGGYPKLGQVITVDLSKMAQLKPGAFVRFTPVSLKAAQNLLRQQGVDLARLAIAAHHQWH